MGNSSPIGASSLTTGPSVILVCAPVLCTFLP
jgi:hypothetical protein